MTANMQLPIINEGMNLLDENELAERTHVHLDSNDDVPDS